MPSNKYPISEYIMNEYNKKFEGLKDAACGIWNDEDGNRLEDWSEINIDALLEIRSTIDELIEEVSHARR